MEYGSMQGHEQKLAGWTWWVIAVRCDLAEFEDSKGNFSAMVI